MAKFIKVCLARIPVRKTTTREERLALLRGYKWPMGKQIRVRFMEGDASLRKKVETSAKIWTQFANISANPEDRTDPAGFADETAPPVAEVADEHAAAAVEGNDPAGFDADEWAGEAPAITEADLVSACAKKQQQTGNGLAIKQVIYKYVKPPKSVKEIPPELRQSFLDELSKL